MVDPSPRRDSRSKVDGDARRDVRVPEGSPHGHFQSAVERGNVLAAVAAARELGRLQLGDALSLVLLFADKAPERFDRAAARWHARFVLEAGDVGLAESELVRAALAELRGPGRSAARKCSPKSVDDAVAGRRTGRSRLCRRHAMNEFAGGRCGQRRFGGRAAPAGGPSSLLRPNLILTRERQCLRLGVRQLRDGVQLLHHPEVVPVRELLNDLAIGEP